MKQQKSINGIVADEQGEPIIGASVLEKGTTNGTITDLDGRFTLSIGKGTELIVSYVGYTTKTVKIGNQSTIKIVLIEDTKTLDEVVVIGYGTQKKSDVSGSVTSVSGDKLSKIPTANCRDGIARYGSRFVGKLWAAVLLVLLPLCRCAV